MSLADASDDLARVKKRLRMLDFALMHYLYEVADCTEPLEGMAFETDDLIGMVEDVRSEIHEERGHASHLHDKVDELSEKLNRVADENDNLRYVLQYLREWDLSQAGLRMLTGAALNGEWEYARSHMIRDVDVDLPEDESSKDGLLLHYSLALGIIEQEAGGVLSGIATAALDGDLKAIRDHAKEHLDQTNGAARSAEASPASRLHEKVDELSEKLNRVADEKEAVETLLSRVFTLVGGQFRPEMSWEETCEKAVDLIVEHWEDDEVPSPPHVSYVACLEEVYQRARLVAELDLPVGTVEELQRLKEAVAIFDARYDCEHADLDVERDARLREAIRMIQKASDPIVVDAIAEAALDEDWDELDAIAEDPFGEDREP